MPDRPDYRFGRRDLVAASTGAAGVSAALNAVGIAKAQTTAAPTATAWFGTVYTGEMIQGKRVVSALDVRDLEPGKKHLLYFRGVQMPTGQHSYVSVTVASGARPGKRIVLTSGVHGDEMSSIHTVQAVMNQLDPVGMSGTVRPSRTSPAPPCRACSADGPMPVEAQTSSI